MTGKDDANYLRTTATAAADDAEREYITNRPPHRRLTAKALGYARAKAIADVFRDQPTPGDGWVNPADIFDRYARDAQTQRAIADALGLSTATVSRAMNGMTPHFIRTADAGPVRRWPLGRQSVEDDPRAVDPEDVIRWRASEQLDRGHPPTVEEVAAHFGLGRTVTASILRYERTSPVIPRPRDRTAARPRLQTQRTRVATITAKRRAAAGLPAGPAILSPTERMAFDLWLRAAPPGNLRPDWVEPGVPLVPGLPHEATARRVVDLIEGETVRLRGEAAGYSKASQHPVVRAMRRWAEGLFTVKAEIEDGKGGYGSLFITREPLADGYSPNAAHGGDVVFMDTSPDLRDALDTFLPGDSALFGIDDLHGDPARHPAATTAKALMARDRRMADESDRGAPVRTFVWRRMEGGLRVYRVE